MPVPPSHKSYPPDPPVSNADRRAARGPQSLGPEETNPTNALGSVHDFLAEAPAMLDHLAAAKDRAQGLP